MKIKISYSNRIALGILFLLLLLAYGFYVMAQPVSDYVNLGIQTKSLANNSSIIHFNAGGNNFGGGTLWISTQRKLSTPKCIQTSQGSEKCCDVKIEGLYYNSQRGERLWPLDENTLASLKAGGTQYGDLQVIGGLYTSCGTGDEWSIYGSVEHKIGKENSFYLIAGVQYDIPQNRMQVNSDLHCTLQLIDNKTAVGYLYDVQGGIGFVGGNVPSQEANEKLAHALSDGKCVSDIFKFTAEDTIEGDPDILGDPWKIANEGSFKNLKWTLAVRGIVGLTNNIFSSNKKDIEGNFGQKSQTVRSDAVSLADSVNIARRKAEQICKGKWNEHKGTVRCFNEEGGELPPINPNQGSITYVFKGVDAQLSSYMEASSPAITIFVDAGKLILPSLVSSGQLLGFNDSGYPDSGNPVSFGNYLKGNFLVNGIVYPSEAPSTGVLNKLYVHGKFLNLNTYDTPTPQRIDQIRTLLNKQSYNESFINYRDLFTWRCADMVKGIASDGTVCGKAKAADLSRASLAIINETYPSLLTE